MTHNLGDDPEPAAASGPPAPETAPTAPPPGFVPIPAPPPGYVGAPTPPPGYVWVPGPPPGYYPPPGQVPPYPGSVPTPAGYGPPPPLIPVIIKPPSVSPSGAPLADFGDRVAAYLIDQLIIGVVTMIPTGAAIAVFIVWAVSHLDNGPLPRAFFLWYLVLFAFILVVVLAVRYLYEVTFLMRYGRTVGKRVMKLDIVGVSTGERLDRRQARKRWLIQGAASVIGVMAWLDGLWQLWDQPYRQCLHDKFAETLVIKVTG